MNCNEIKNIKEELISKGFMVNDEYSADNRTILTLDLDDDNERDDNDQLLYEITSVNISFLQNEFMTIDINIRVPEIEDGRLEFVNIETINMYRGKVETTEFFYSILNSTMIGQFLSTRDKSIFIKFAVNSGYLSQEINPISISEFGEYLENKKREGLISNAKNNINSSLLGDEDKEQLINSIQIINDYISIHVLYEISNDLDDYLPYDENDEPINLADGKCEDEE
jgi:hypothetical protein